ncbi:Regulatory protein MsrR [Corynebacterium kalinowskii]|uniref:Regulatory protein MsrR n=1 Tax=Corynebacterium kalinowskii TaxID=2675216 RepID=A0A6B8VPY9_9CORY|nr:LCP family protein [Corynebacterium kalinowskii]QGU01095.1 Regulatory protein MsrR [Corynebacterium kalinowskii]
MTYGDDIARDRNGKPILDRYGRPVRKRPNTKRQQPPQRRPRREERQQPLDDRTRTDMPRVERPQQVRPPQSRPQQERARQYIPPSRPTPQQRPQPQRPQPAAPKQQGYRPTRRRQAPGCLRGVGALLLVAVLLLAGVFLWADTKLTRVEALPDDRIANTAGTNWLLVGSDSRQGLSEDQIAELNTGGDIGVGRTDTIMLLHIPRSGQPTLISIPRDSYVNIPGHGEDKINSAFTIGGPQLLTQTVEQSTGLRIDHYAEIGFGGFAGMVDAVGGVEICVDEPIADDVISLYLDAGCQKMDGPTALSYVRTRATPMGDLDRVERQRKFFSALMDKATSPATIVNPFRTIPLISKTGSAFIVGEKDHAWHLARVALSLKSGVRTETIPLGGFADTAVGSVVLWDEAGTEALLAPLR